MKLILVPTDFSKTARNAVNYAAEVAKRAKARLVLFHSYHPAVIISEAPVIIPSPDEQEKECIKRLKRIRYDLIAKHGSGINVDMVCVEGLATDAIARYADEHGADLVVVGTHGAGYFEEKLVGSVTSTLIARSKVPVLSVSAATKFKSIKQIVLATDYLGLSSPAILNPMKEIAGVFRSHIYVLNVVEKENEIPSVSQAVEGIKLEHILEGTNHSFHSTTDSDIVKGINAFAEARHMDMVVMVPRKHSFFKTLLSRRNSKAMAFHTQTPLLTIHN